MATYRVCKVVSCVKTKRNLRSMAKERYTATYFVKMQTYAERPHDEWYLLSAKYGASELEGDLIEPYEKTLSGARMAITVEWTKEVGAQIRAMGLLKQGLTYVFHAGRD